MHHHHHPDDTHPFSYPQDPLLTLCYSLLPAANVAASSQAAGAVRAYDVCEWALENASTLRLTVGQGTIPDFMRKLAAVQADVEQMERLYRLEESVRGKNTHAGVWGLQTM